jgi:hypothetical protein
MGVLLFSPENSVPIIEPILGQRSFVGFKALRKNERTRRRQRRWQSPFARGLTG